MSIQLNYCCDGPFCLKFKKIERKYHLSESIVQTFEMNFVIIMYKVDGYVAIC